MRSHQPQRQIGHFLPLTSGAFAHYRGCLQHHFLPWSHTKIYKVKTIPAISVVAGYYLYWDGSILPVLSEVNLWNQAVVSGSVSQEDNRENAKSIGYDADTEQDEDSLLEASPLTQKRCGVIIMVHIRIWSYPTVFYSETTFYTATGKWSQ